MDRASGDNSVLWPCPRCRRPIASSSLFCPLCGLRLVPTTHPELGPGAPLLHAPDVAEDLRAFPQILRVRRTWLPLGLLLVGFLLALLIYDMPVDLQQWVALYLQFFFVPQGLVLYVIAGIVAPRASYVFGAIWAS